MSEAKNSPSIDMIRWTFSVDPEHREAIQTYLADLGLDVFVHGESQFHVSWDEPDRDMNEVISEIWAIHGEPFDITLEEFHRVGLSLLQQDDDHERSAA